MLKRSHCPICGQPDQLHESTCDFCNLEVFISVCDSVPPEIDRTEIRKRKYAAEENLREGIRSLIAAGRPQLLDNAANVAKKRVIPVLDAAAKEEFLGKIAQHRQRLQRENKRLTREIIEAHAVLAALDYV